ncbi:MAG: phosphoribosylglycinamide formyltransferase [Bacteroidales bacterium]|nr:phosphoribosylglycinamide formyltransferase [Bacteroidales bacterium]
MKNIAIFASGSGTNAQAIADHFSGGSEANIACILSNKENAYVLERAKRLTIPAYTFTREEFYGSDRILKILEGHRIDFVVLAGFLWLVPENLITAYPRAIVNIHPALLPKYGGKGMYGGKVHEAVIANGEKESGITIHYVNQHYDEGTTIFQARCEVKPGDTPATLANRIHELEHKHYPEVIRQLIQKTTSGK